MRAGCGVLPHSLPHSRRMHDVDQANEKKPGPRDPGLDSAPCVKGRRASCFDYLNVMVLVCVPPRTGELEKTFTLVGFTAHVAASVGSCAPPGEPTWSYR